MNELLIIFLVVGGFGFGLAIASYRNLRFLKKMQVRLDELRKEIEKDG